MALFTKMQGLGNTFVVFRGPLDLTRDEIISYCQQYGERRADGLLVVTPIDDKNVQMKYWNSDGSIAEMCGNGLRCIARFAVGNGMMKPGSFNVQTDAGILNVVWKGDDENNIEVQVGKVIPGEAINIHGRDFYTACVGNPHAVTFVSDVDKAPVKELGPQVENDVHFPNKTNVEFVEVLNNHEISLRTWERGSGETLACGTGMTVAASISAKNKGVSYPMTVKVLGGEAKFWIDSDGFTRMKGPALIVS